MKIFFIVIDRRLFEEDNPLVISLEASVTSRNSKLILRDNTYSTIQWDAFTQPELNNFILILRREEDLYIDKVWVRGGREGREGVRVRERVRERWKERARERGRKLGRAGER